MCLPILPLFFQHWCLQFISILTENGAHQHCKFQITEWVLYVTVILKGGDKESIYQQKIKIFKLNTHEKKKAK